MARYTTDNPNISMGCLASIHGWLGTGSPEINVDMYSRVNHGMYSSVLYPDMTKEEALQRVQEAASEVIAALPSSIYLGLDKANKAAEDGIINMRYKQHPAVVHSRIAPFRSFIEIGHTLPFFDRFKEVDVLGAWVASHIFGMSNISALSSDGSLNLHYAQGFHQSMFPGLEGNKSSLSSGYNIRRIAALYPELRRHLEPVLLGMGESNGRGYVLPELRFSSAVAVTRAVIGMLKGQPPFMISSQKGQQQLVQTMRLWHDTVYNTLDNLETPDDE